MQFAIENLKNLLDQSGELMQIREIVTEAVPGGAGAQAGVFGKALAGALGQKIAPGINTGNQTATTAPGMRAQAAQQTNQAAVAVLADKGQKAWVQTLKQMIANSDNIALSPNQLDINDIKESLDDMVNTMLGFDPAVMTRLTTPEAKAAVEKLNNGIAMVLKASSTPQTNDVAMKAAWAMLALGIAESQNAKTFSNTGTSGQGKLPEVTVGANGKLLYDGRPFNGSDPRHVTMAQIMANQAAAKK
jgi:hypothetical protein